MPIAKMEVKPKKKFSNRAQEDLELVRKALETKNPKTFERLMKKYRDSIYFMVLKMVHNKDEAEDITMISFGKAFNNLAKYNQKYAFSTWLFKIATNNCIDYIRKKRLETTSLDEDIENDKSENYTLDVKSDMLTPEEEVMKTQRIVSVRGTVERLDPKYKILIQLRYYEELSYEEIAEQLNIPLGTVKAQLFRAKEMVFNLIKKHRYKI